MQKSIHSPQQRPLLILLRQIRVDAGLTQVQLAERLEIPQTWISNYERGERKLDVLELRQVCRALGVPFIEFMARLDAALAEVELEPQLRDTNDRNDTNPISRRFTEGKPR